MFHGIAAGSTDVLLGFCACMGWPEGSRYMQSKPHKILIQGKFSESVFGSWKFKVYFPYLSFMLSSSWKSDSSQLTFQSQVIRISWMQHDTKWYNQIFSGSQPTQSWHPSSSISQRVTWKACGTSEWNASAQRVWRLHDEFPCLHPLLYMNFFKVQICVSRKLEHEHVAINITHL